MEISRCCYTKRDWFTVTGVPVAGVSFILVLAIRALSAIAKLFGNMGAYHYFAYTAKKFYAVYVQHNITYFSSAPLPRLTYAKNIVRRDVIWNEEDRKATTLMRELFLRQNPDHAGFEKLTNASIRGAKSTGICFGATHAFIKGCLDKNIQNEAELIEFAQSFEEGFDKEAAALQVVYQKLYPYRQLQFFNLQPHFNSLSNLVGLNSGECDYYNLAEQAGQDDFNAMENGLWSVHFNTNPGAHAVAYLKFAFGSYIFDSNKGLMTTGDKTAACALKTLQESYSSTSSTSSTSSVRLRRHEPHA